VTVRCDALQKMPGGEIAINTFHFGGIDRDAVITTSQSRVLAYYTALKNILSTQWSLTRLTWRLVGPNNPPLEHTPSPAIVGTQTANPLPNDVALVVSWKTALAGKSYRGRTYIGGLTQNALGTASDGSCALIAASGTTIDTAVGSLAPLTGENKLVVYSPTLGEANVVIGATRGNRFDTQRRRENRLAEIRTVIPFV
jgi:hypothetical protein